MIRFEISYPKGDIDIDLAAFRLTEYGQNRYQMRNDSDFVFYGNPSQYGCKYEDKTVINRVTRSIRINDMDRFLVVASIYRPEDRGHLMGQTDVECRVTNKDKEHILYLNEEFPYAMSVQLGWTSAMKLQLTGLGQKTDLRQYVGLFNPNGKISH